MVKLDTRYVAIPVPNNCGDEASLALYVADQFKRLSKISFYSKEFLLPAVNILGKCFFLNIQVLNFLMKCVIASTVSCMMSMLVPNFQEDRYLYKYESKPHALTQIRLEE